MNNKRARVKIKLNGLKTWLLNPAWWLDWSRFNKIFAGATTRQNLSHPAGQLMTRANPDKTRCFFSFQM
jgi:hypothetical protein